MLFLLFLLFGLIWSAQFYTFYDAGVSQNFKDATTLAANNVRSFLVLSNDVNIKFEWALLTSGAIADTFIPFVCQDPINIYVMLPPALYVQKHGNTGNCVSYTSEPFFHMIVRFNMDPTVNFYVGTDPNGLSYGKHDLVSVAMHEIVHGLGMMSFVVDVNGNIANAPFGFLFDWIVFQNAAGSGWPSTYGSVPVNNPAVSNTAILTSGMLLFPGNYSFPLYTPVAFVYGVSVSHTTGAGLMYYKSVRGQLRRSLTAYVISMLQRLGYETQGCASPDWSVPCGNCVSGTACATSGSSGLFSFLFIK